MNIVFLGTPDFAQKSLQALYEAGHNIIGVVTNVDKPKGRGMKLIASPVKNYALEKNLKIMQPVKVKNNEEFINEIKSLSPDLLCVVAYGKILPKELLAVPKYGAINVHGSLLPKYRGAAPIQWAVINGDKETGITTMFMDEGMDTGDMILKETTQIGEDETTGEVWERLSNIGAKLLVQTVNKIEEISKTINENTPAQEEIKKKIGAEKQGNDFTLAPMLDKEMARINWNESAIKIKNLVRGLNPIMGAYTFIDGKKLKIWKVQAHDNANGNNKNNSNNNDDTNTNPISKLDSSDLSNIQEKQNGEIIVADNKKGLFIKTGEGIIEVLEVQGENGKKMDAKSFLNGNQIKEKMCRAS